MRAKALYGFADHVPETEEYGVTSYVYRARRPLISEKIISVLNGGLPAVIRAKGHFWIATRPDWVAEFWLAGALSSVKPLGIWWAAVPKERWPDHESARVYMQAHWQEPWGDRRPAELRAWMASGVLPWRPRSVRRPSTQRSRAIRTRPACCANSTTSESGSSRRTSARFGAKNTLWSRRHDAPAG